MRTARANRTKSPETAKLLRAGSTSSRKSLGEPSDVVHAGDHAPHLAQARKPRAARKSQPKPIQSLLSVQALLPAPSAEQQLSAEQQPSEEQASAEQPQTLPAASVPVGMQAFGDGLAAAVLIRHLLGESLFDAGRSLANLAVAARLPGPASPKNPWRDSAAGWQEKRSSAKNKSSLPAAGLQRKTRSLTKSPQEVAQ